jgi:DNA-binding MarR family transcriptional regulator
MSKDDELFSMRWGIPILDEGHTTIPNFFFDHYTEVGISRSEFLLILHLARYKYESPGSESRPSVPTVAKQMGYSKRMVQKLLAGLEERGMMVRHFQDGRPTIYDFGGFSRAILKAALLDENECSRGDPQFTPKKLRDEPQFTPTHELQFTPPMNYSSPEEQKQEEKTTSGGGGVSPVDQNALAALLEIGVTPDQAEKWAAVFEPEDVTGWCEYAKSAAGITNPPGLVVAMLRDGAPPPPRMGIKPEPEPVPRSPPQVEPIEPIPISGTDLDAREVWSHVLEELRMQMTRPAFDTWLSGSQVVDVDDGTVTVQVRDGYAVDWLAERWIKPIQRTLAGVVGQGDLNVEFVAGEM